MQRLLTAARSALVICALAMPGLASAAACATGSLSSYLGLTSCSVGTLTLDQFALFDLPTGASPIDTDRVTVTPIATAGTSGLSLTLADGLDAPGGGLFELLFGFRASLGGGSLVDNTLRLLGPITVASDGVITGVQDLCVGAAIAADLSCAGTPVSAVVFDDGTDSESVVTSALAAAGPIGVLLDLAVDGGTSGRASLGPGGGVSTVFTVRAVPEPSTLLSTLLALCVVFGCVRGRPARRSGRG